MKPPPDANIAINGSNQQLVTGAYLWESKVGGRRSSSRKQLLKTSTSPSLRLFSLSGSPQNHPLNIYFLRFDDNIITTMTSKVLLLLLTSITSIVSPFTMNSITAATGRHPHCDLPGDPVRALIFASFISDLSCDRCITL